MKKALLKLTDKQQTAGIIMVISLVLAALGAGYIIGRNSTTISSYKECAAAGNAIQESYPEVCVTLDGKRFINNY